MGRNKLFEPSRDATARQLAAEYTEQDVSIRDLADRHGVSYGTMRLLLIEGGAEFRGRGSNVRRPKL